MQRILPLAVAALCGAALLSPAYGQPPEPPAGPPVEPADAFIKQLDTDGDGKVSLDEALKPQDARMAQVDSNGDGAITPEEASAAFKAQVPPEMLKAMQERGMPDPGETFVKNLDKNGDGKVDKEEFQQPTIGSFKRMDADSDGFAIREEAVVFFEDMKKHMQEQMERMQQQPPAPPQQ